MGYETGRFEGNLRPDLICNICHEVFEDPVQTLDCDHYFCRKCITDWLKNHTTCPQDMLCLTVSGLQEVSCFVKTTLADLDIKCSFRCLGCQAIVKLNLLEDHEKECLFNEEALVACDRDCGASFKRKDGEDHYCLIYLKSVIQENEETQKDMMAAFEGERRELGEALGREVNKVEEMREKLEKMRDEMKEMKEKTIKEMEAMSEDKEPRDEQKKNSQEETKLRKYIKQLNETIEKFKSLGRQINRADEMKEEMREEVGKMKKEMEEMRKIMNQEIIGLRQEHLMDEQVKKDLRESVKQLQETIKHMKPQPHPSKCSSLKRKVASLPRAPSKRGTAALLSPKREGESYDGYKRLFSPRKLCSERQ